MINSTGRGRGAEFREPEKLRHRGENDEQQVGKVRHMFLVVEHDIQPDPKDAGGDEKNGEQ